MGGVQRQTKYNNLVLLCKRAESVRCVGLVTIQNEETITACFIFSSCFGFDVTLEPAEPNSWSVHPFGECDILCQGSVEADYSSTEIVPCVAWIITSSFKIPAGKFSTYNHQRLHDCLGPKSS